MTSTSQTPNSPSRSIPDHARTERAIGALLGSVVGDALGAPFEFGPAGTYQARFPERVLLDPSEMTGGGAWSPAEWTDDTQMALLVAESLLDCGGIDEADLFDRFRQWASGGPKDMGIQTSSVLLSSLPWSRAATDHFERTGRAAGNGSLMRTVPAAIYFAGAGTAVTVDAAQCISALTHGDPAAGDGCAIFHELIRLLLDGGDPFADLTHVIDIVPIERRAMWSDRLADGYDPAADPIVNGAVWPALAAAVWAVRTTSSFEAAVTAAIGLGGDTDTVACITAGLAGARYGVGAIPSRWTTYLHGDLIGRVGSAYRVEDLQRLAGDLLAGTRSPAPQPPPEHVVEPTLVWADQSIYAASFPGAAAALAAGSLPDNAMVISLSRTLGELEAHRPRRQVWLIDQSDPHRNLSLGLVLDDVIDTMQAAVAAGMPVVVHCHGGRSRTGLVLRAWALSRDADLSVPDATADVADRWPHLVQWNDRFDDALGPWIAARRSRAGCVNLTPITGHVT
jgi:ADP-ribosyl-[dinitrogen reductase] hydrolase